MKLFIRAIKKYFINLIIYPNNKLINSYVQGIDD